MRNELNVVGGVPIHEFPISISELSHPVGTAAGLNNVSINCFNDSCNNIHIAIHDDAPNPTTPLSS